MCHVRSTAEARVHCLGFRVESAGFLGPLFQTEEPLTEYLVNTLHNRELLRMMASLYLVARGLFLGSRVSTVGSLHPPRFEAIHTLFAQKRCEGLGSEV